MDFEKPEKNLVEASSRHSDKSVWSQGKGEVGGGHSGHWHPGESQVRGVEELPLRPQGA